MSEFDKEIEEILTDVRKRIETVTTKLEEFGSLAEELARARDELGETGGALCPAIDAIKSSADSLQGLAASVNQVLGGYEQITRAILDSDFAQVKASVDVLCVDVARIQTEFSREIANAVEQINTQGVTLARSVESINAPVLAKLGEGHNEIAVLGQTLQSISAEIQASRDAAASETKSLDANIGSKVSDLGNSLSRTVETAYSRHKVDAEAADGRMRQAITDESREVREILGDLSQKFAGGIEDLEGRVNRAVETAYARCKTDTDETGVRIRDAIAAESHRSQATLAEMHQDLANRSGGIEEQIKEGIDSVRTKGTENTDTLSDAVAAENRDLRVALDQAFQVLSRQQKQNTNAVIVTGIIGVVVVCGVIAYLHYFA